MVTDSSLGPTGISPVVLIVDDDRDTRDLFRTIFELEGFRVTNAADADGALERAAHLQPDVIVTDVGLAHGVDGVGLVSLIQARPSIAHVPVIAVTGRSPWDISSDAGFREVLQKPISPNELVAATRRVLAGSAALGLCGQNSRP